MLRAVRCPRCASICLKLKEHSKLEWALLLVVGHKHYECGGCGQAFRARDRRAAVRRTALRCWIFVILAGSVTVCFHSAVFEDFPGWAQKELRADVISVKEDGLLAAQESETILGDLSLLWQDVKYEAARLRASVFPEPETTAASQLNSGPK